MCYQYYCTIYRNIVKRVFHSYANKHQQVFGDDILKENHMDMCPKMHHYWDTTCQSFGIFYTDKRLHEIISNMVKLKLPYNLKLTEFFFQISGADLGMVCRIFNKIHVTNLITNLITIFDYPSISYCKSVFFCMLYRWRVILNFVRLWQAICMHFPRCWWLNLG